ncbi:MAG: amidohydrolase family protein [Eubacteriales bacterium]|nr:amidohydrolase family protein [Eubacteriales bacterium]
MVIDFHTHTFPEAIAHKTINILEKRCGQKAYTDGTLNGLFLQMQAGGIDMSVIQPVVTRPEQFKTINNTSCYINEHYEGSIISFGGIHPDSADYKGELKTIKAMGLKGIKLHPDYQNTFIDDIKYMHIIDFASELGLITLIHAGVDVGIPKPVHCTPLAADNMLRQVNPERLILAHLGGCDMWDDVERYLIGKNVYLDTAVIYGRISNEQFTRIVNGHGADKILFATDSPWCEQKSSVQWINDQTLSENEKQLIFSDNACRLLNICGC